jgi:AhpD family alkylhydroperoxidase
VIERLPYDEINSRAINGLAALKKHVLNIDDNLKALVELRVSQINGCVYCLDLLAREARALGESQQRLDCLSAWPEYPFFDDREKAAFKWSETITHISDSHAPDAAYDPVKVNFSDEEMVDLTLVISFHL